jgi:carbon storage regulator
MLVLSRKSDQKIVIGSEILLTVLAIKGNRVTIGIDAPPSVNIKRRELVVGDSCCPEASDTTPVCTTPIGPENLGVVVAG